MKDKTLSSRLLTLLLGVILAIAGLNQTLLASENNHLPITKVVLFKHGVGYFEHQGTVSAEKPLELFFKQEQMNDLLKSLIAIDQSGQPLAGIVYDSTKTIEQQLSAYNFNLQGPTDMGGLLMQLTGSDVEIVTLSDTIYSGKVLGVKFRPIIEDEVERHQAVLTLLLDSGKIESIEVDFITSLEFLDERLNNDIQHYLSLLFQQHKRDEKKVTIHLTGTGARPFAMSYICESPIWKTSYRAILPDDKSDDIDLQGWAMVDNVSDEDWDDVELSLVSGLPISFVQNLYEPIFKKRPVIAYDRNAAVAPTIAEAALNAVPAPQQMRRFKKSSNAHEAKDEMMAFGAGMPGMLMPGMSMPAMEGAADITVEQMRDLQSQAVTREIGDLFEYKIDHRVTIERNRSAMLPIAAVKAAGRSVSLYNEETRDKNPMAAFHFTNTSGLTLEGGPITVYQQESYVGEGLVETIKPDEKRYITYAVDLGTHADVNYDSKNEKVFRVKIQNGVMHCYRYIQEAKTYHFNNVDAKVKTVIVEHPRHHGWELLTPKEPLETTEHFYRFEVELPSRDKASLMVKERHDQREIIHIRSISDENIDYYFSQNYFTKEVKERLTKIVAIKSTIAKQQKTLEELQQQREQLGQDQNRLSEIRRKMRDTPEEIKQANRYITKIGELESKIEDVDRDIDKTRETIANLQQQLEQMIRDLDVDLTL